jgi:hypothetical protein
MKWNFESGVRGDVVLARERKDATRPEPPILIGSGDGVDDDDDDDDDDGKESSDG